LGLEGYCAVLRTHAPRRTKRYNGWDSLEPDDMDVEETLAQLKAKRAEIEEAILSLERLARGRHRGPGRPPNMMADYTTPPPKRRPPDLPPAALRLQRHRNGLAWAVAGRKRTA
jgi:hypothetical protein